MRPWTLKAKLRLALALMWLGLVGVGVWSAMETRATMLDERKTGLQNLVDAAEGVAKLYHAKVQSGAMSEDEAKRTALATLASMRYGTMGYLFVVDSQLILQMHPTLADMVGKSTAQFRDPTGKPVYPTIVNAAKDKGYGFAEYQGRQPGSDTALPKIGYVKRFAPWDWNISSAVFLQEVDAAYVHSLTANLIVILVVGSVVTLAMSLIIRNVQRGLGGEPTYATEIARRIAGGDLAVHVRTRPDDRDSMLFAMAQMQQQLTGTIGNIKTSADSIASATKQIATGNADLSQRTEEQASSLEETASSMEELTSIVKQNADNARQASTLAVNASGIAAKGGEVVDRVVETMAGINDSSKKIADIIGVIEGIAFQTNILALNAAVEAARAGEQGRGFAVVAGEVRGLAQRSAGAAKEIKELISDSVGRVENGTTLVAEAGTVIDEVVVAVKHVTDIMSEISAASDEQSSGIEQVNQAVNQMDEATQQNAALVEEAAAAALSLEEQAQLLRDAVASFHTA
ncbi:methyl-accepting chemotaxis protein [Ralstonia solanacearum P673]|uniref:methyl-accepting chemotaxis protein n=1 Tax=Ralstonia solanacearum TaxID=305 RepID=UPI002029D936|nr:methyl-accepting chemotaxis protein [Ralstonia solanacearum]MCL9847890.1 methyl-accepting chemotaxis protein [Ralstonia solanacearum]MCL9852621.1 methyl-accepting chemotaxis protein [Ralstonia solanacearum]MCL9859768.1 methyl-accepting chemotaxis protein [Ralstonia solanacearum]MCL9861985.1 methyl-accepting chemotaxis protein [Ralstonia solanacearum]MCL9866757.1 methyl-accepting chemotaxis protein [Ralstonia solanacearum]